MNNWFRLALISILGLIVSIMALNVLSPDDGMNGMNMGVTSNQNMTMGSADMPMTNINSSQGSYNYYPRQWGINIMRERMPYWVRYGMGNMPMQNMNIGQMPMQNMNMGQMPMQNMNMGQMPMQNMNMGQMPMQNMNMSQMPMQNMNMSQMPMQNNASMQGNMGQMQM